MATKLLSTPFDKLKITQIGTKAFNLSVLFAHKIKIPRSAFISVQAQKKLYKRSGLLKEIAAINRLDERQLDHHLEALRSKILRLDLAPLLKPDIEALLKSWLKSDVEAVAVRSSAINEDLQDVSFAGQYDTILNIEPDWLHIQKAIKDVWASEWTAAVIAYKRSKGLNLQNFGMAVIIQEQVKSRYAGVVFTADPQGLSDEHLIIEFVEGTGDALVSGQVTPTHIKWSRSQDNTARVSNMDPALGAIFKKIVESSLRAESIMEQPADLEWAVRGNRVYFLQMRPITALGDSILWTDENVGEVIPDVVSPYSWSILDPITNQAFAWFLKKVGISDYPENGLFGLYRGKAYFNNTLFTRTLNRFYFRKKGAYLGTRYPFRMLRNLLYIIRSAFKIFFMTTRLPSRILTYLKKYPACLELLQFKQGRSAVEYWRQSEQIIEQHISTMSLHLACTIFGELFYQFLNKLCNSWLDQKDKINADKLLAGLKGASSTESGRELFELSRRIAQNPQYRSLFINKSVEDIRLAVFAGEQFPGLTDWMNTYIAAFGHGALNEFELFYPRWWENPDYLIQALKSYISNMGADRAGPPEPDVPPIREESERRAREQLNLPKKIIFKWVVSKASFFSTQRENIKQAFLKLHSELKKLLLALGAELVKKHTLQSEEDILFLTQSEIASIVNGRQLNQSLDSLIPRRKQERADNLKFTHPKKLRQKGKVWHAIDEGIVEGSNVLKGIACSSGLVEGHARIVLNPGQFEHVKKGDILITKSTNPGWAPLFLLAGAVVTEIGGALSHGAIIAREYGLPMVAAVPGITTSLRNGQKVRVNGSAGLVEILDN